MVGVTVGALLLFVYAFVSTAAVALMPHEPVVIWYGSHLGVWRTALVATAGTATASAVDHRLFGPWLGRVSRRPELTGGGFGWIRRWFLRAPFAVLALSGLTPLPALPFKVAALTERYPLAHYVAATVVGRFPRYVLLAWLGFALSLPNWVYLVLAILFLFPTIKGWLRQWKPLNGK